MIRKSKLKPRMWLKQACLLAAMLLPACMQSQQPAYAYSRALKPVDSTGYYKLRLNSGILYKSRPSGVVRVYEVSGKDSVEVPYLLADRFDQPVLLAPRPLQLINTSYVKGSASYCTFVMDTASVYSSLSLSIAEDEYDKELALEGSDDNQHWKTILEKDKVFRFSDPAEGYFTRNTIYFLPQDYKYLRLTFNDSHTGRIHITGATIPNAGRLADEPADETVPFTMTRTEDKQGRKTIIECDFKRPYAATGLKFDVSNHGDLYRRSIHLYQSAVNRQHQQQWLLLQDDYLVSGSDNYIAARMGDGAAWPFTETNKLRIEIDNKDNSPLEEIRLQIFTLNKALRLKLEKGRRYVLAYGSIHDAAPEYDLAYFQSHVPSRLREAGLEEEVAHVKNTAVAPAKEPFFKSAAWIWTLMIVSILAIGGFAASLLRQSKAGKQD